MPPRSSLTSSFALNDTKEEVHCPLDNQDGSKCRKRCTGEKRYRSMQEHIRRAHQEHYIPKLPATEESFLLMINTPPSESRNNNSSSSSGQGFYDNSAYAFDELSNNPATPRNWDDIARLEGTASAAAALAGLGGSYDRDSTDGDHYSHIDSSANRPRSSVEHPTRLPGIEHIGDIRSDPFSNQARRPISSILNHSPPNRSSTLPPSNGPLGPNRGRKSSISKKSHRKKLSREIAHDWLHRVQNEDRPLGYDGRPYSAEPAALDPSRMRGQSRIHELLEAASMSGDLDDRTSVPRSPISNDNRGSLPPLAAYPQLSSNNYQASPLQQALTPPSNTHDVMPFPSVEDSDPYIGGSALSDSSPTLAARKPCLYCSACHSAADVNKSYACTECISGFCGACVEVLTKEHGERRQCPRCNTIGGMFKPIQLEIKMR